MSTYKIKSILDNIIIIEYKLANGSLRELTIGIEKDWDKQRIEEEIAQQKKAADTREVKLNLAQYFSKGEELEFLDVPSEEEKIEEMNKLFQEEQRVLREQENKRFLDKWSSKMVFVSIHRRTIRCIILDEARNNGTHSRN